MALMPPTREDIERSKAMLERNRKMGIPTGAEEFYNDATVQAQKELLKTSQGPIPTAADMAAKEEAKRKAMAGLTK